MTSGILRILFTVNISEGILILHENYIYFRIPSLKRRSVSDENRKVYYRVMQCAVCIRMRNWDKYVSCIVIFCFFFIEKSNYLRVYTDDFPTKSRDHIIMSYIIYCAGTPRWSQQYIIPSILVFILFFFFSKYIITNLSECALHDIRVYIM